MRAKFLKVADAGTDMRFLVLQLEEIDLRKLEHFPYSPGMIVLIQFTSAGARATSARNFPSLPAIPATWHGGDVSDDGTVFALKEYLRFIPDIRSLPEEVNVEAGRVVLSHVLCSCFIDKDLREIVAENGGEHLRKVLYEPFSMQHLAVVDIEENEVVYDCSSTCPDWLLAKYLWLPVKEIGEIELQGIRLTPFRHEIIRPELT